MKLYRLSGFLLIGAFCNSYADDINLRQFQNFDDQISLSYGYSSSKLTNANNSYITQSSYNQTLGLDVEKLYDNHVWFNVNGSFDIKTTQSNNNQPFIGSVQNLGFPASLTGKVGYSFPIVNRLQIVPYATTGLMLNYNGVNIPEVGFNNSYYYLMGGGAFVEFIAIEDKLSFYFDQKIAYLADQSGITYNQDAMNYVSTLGLKYNAGDKVQLGLEGSYNQISLLNANAGFDPVTYSSRNNNQSTWGGLLSIGYLYDKKNNTASNTGNIAAIDDSFRDFDNVYSLGYGYSVSHNSNVKTNLNYLELDINHLFDNQVWLNLNGQLATNISQVNAIDTRYSNYAPTYLTYPGSATTSLGYAFVLIDDKLQLIPYANAGIVMNINAYTISENQSVSEQLAKDMYFQYGAGGRLEYTLNQDFQVYYDQLFAGLSDRSGLGLGLFKSNSVIGINYHVYEPLQVGFALNYENLSSTGTPSSQVPQPVLLNQSTFGGLISLGLRY